MQDGLNLGNSIFENFNDKRGLMICGYEWGFSKIDQQLQEQGAAHEIDRSAITTFSNKSPSHGARAFAWPYDNRIIKWFDIWGHPLNRSGLGGDFDKCIVQTNWCNTEDNHIQGDYFQKLTAEDQVDNFINHIFNLEPTLIIFMGSKIIDILQDHKILSRFVEIMGPPTGEPRRIQKNYAGRRFKIGFQTFEKCETLSLPHPTGSKGLSDGYISLFKDEISQLIQNFKNIKGVV